MKERERMGSLNITEIYCATQKKEELKLVDIDKLMATIQTDEKNNNGEIVDVIVCSRRISIYAFLITYLQ